MNRYHASIRDARGGRIVEISDVTASDVTDCVRITMEQAALFHGISEPEVGEQIAVTVTRLT